MSTPGSGWTGAGTSSCKTTKTCLISLIIYSLLVEAVSTATVKHCYTFSAVAKLLYEALRSAGSTRGQSQPAHSSQQRGKAAQATSELYWHSIRQSLHDCQLFQKERKKSLRLSAISCVSCFKRLKRKPVSRFMSDNC